jgi:hypothetical protein
MKLGLGLAALILAGILASLGIALIKPKVSVIVLED